MAKHRLPDETERMTQALVTMADLSPGDLRFHLAGIDQETVSRTIRAYGLAQGVGRIPWERVLRRIHGVEVSRLPEWLEQLKSVGASALEDVGDLDRALRRPLVRFAEMARGLGYMPNTYSRSLKEGREKLPFPTIQLGDRLRLYRPLDVILWRDHQLVLDLPPSLYAVSAAKAAEPAEPGPEPLEPAPTEPAERAHKAVFGRFGRNKRNATA